MAFTLRDVAPSERPRERLMKYGCKSLSNAELIALLLGSGTAEQPVMQAAQVVLKKFTDLGELSECSYEELSELVGIGPAKACGLLACFELAKRMALEVRHVRLISSPQDAANSARAFIQDFHKEHTIVLSFDSRNRLIKSDEISVGILNASLVHPREVFGIAIKRHAASIVLCHNHPSGDTEPSPEDIELTERISTAGQIIGIPLLDHLIISKTKFTSVKGDL